MNYARNPWSVLPVALAAALLGQAVVLAWVRSGTSFDGAEQLLYTQYLDWGYGRSQPPLYTWLLWGMQRVFGVSLLAEHVLKFGLMAAGLWAIWSLARQIGANAAAAAAAVLSAFLVVEIGWEFQRNYAHSVLLFALTGALGLAYLRGAILWCGVVVGLIVLAKYNGGLVVLALVLADGLGPRRFWSSRGAGALGLTVAFCVPHGIWALANAEAVFALTDAFVADATWPRAALGALGAYALAVLGVGAFLAVFAGLARWRTALVVPDTNARVLWRWAWAFWAIGLGVSIAAGLDRVNMRWLLPGLVPFLPVFAMMVLAARPGLGPWMRGVGLGLAVVFTIGQWIESTRVNARTDFDYAALAAAMEADGLPPVLVFRDYPVFANLRFYGAFTMLQPEMPDPVRFAAERMTVLGNAMDWASELGMCPEVEPITYQLERRSVDETRSVSAQVVSRMACN